MSAELALRRLPNVVQVDTWAAGLQTLSTRIMAEPHGFGISSTHTDQDFEQWRARLHQLHASRYPTPSDEQRLYVIADQPQATPTADVAGQVALWMAVGATGLPPNIDAPARYAQAVLVPRFDVLHLEATYWVGPDSVLAASALQLLRAAEMDGAAELGPLIVHFLQLDNQLLLATRPGQVDVAGWVARACECPVCYTVTCEGMACGTCHKPLCLPCHGTMVANARGDTYRCPSCGIQDAGRPPYAISDGLHQNHTVAHIPEEQKMALTALLTMLAELVAVLNHQPCTDLDADSWCLDQVAQPLLRDRDPERFELALVFLDIFHRQELFEHLQSACLTERVLLVSVSWSSPTATLA